MATKTAILDIETQIEKLRERKRTLIVKSADRFARAATKSGLAEMEIADEEVDRIFEEIAARFHKGEEKRPGRSAAFTRGQANDGAGAEAEASHDS